VVIRMVRWMIRLAVASMVLVLVMSVVHRVADPGDSVLAAEEEEEGEVVQLKGRVAELELQLEEAREEIRRLRDEQPEDAPVPTNGSIAQPGSRGAPAAGEEIRPPRDEPRQSPASRP